MFLDVLTVLGVPNVADLKTRRDQRDLGTTEVWSDRNSIPAIDCLCRSQRSRGAPDSG